MCSSRARAAALAAAVAAALAGCTPTICSRTSDCTTGFVCTIAGLCIVPPVDAATDDGTGTTSTQDAGTAMVSDAAADAPDGDAPDADLGGL